MLFRSNARLLVYSTPSELFWNSIDEQGEKAVFDLINYDITDAVVINDEAIKDKDTVRRIILDARAHGLPVITIGAQYPGCTQITFDYTAGFEKIVRHVIADHNVKNIHMIAGIKGNAFSEERIDVVRNVAAEYDVDFGNDDISYGEFWSVPTESAVEQLFVHRRRLPQAIICANDTMAITTVSVLKRHGIKIPENVIVTGFDGINEIRYSTPQITTCLCSSEHLARTVSDTIMQMLSGRAVPGSVLVVPELQASESCGSLMAKYPMTTIEASGMAVGLPDGQMGNSEVGHTNMGAGRIVYQQLTLITKSIKDGEMLKNPVLVKNMQAAIDAGKAIHLMGLVGTGGVHSHADHWFGVLEMAKHLGAKNVYLHCITDGRDTDPHSGKGFLADLQAKLDELGIGKIASVSGRYYAMDRDNNWDREEKAYAAFVYGEGNHAANAAEAIEASYAADKTDEFVLPCVTCEGGRVQDGDTVIFMNFRPDRARQMTRIFCDDAFTGFERRGGRKQVNYVCMAEYDATMPNCEVAYPPVELKNVLGQYLSENGKTQLRIAETEKYAHVTFFFNGGVEAPYEGEDRCVIPSPKVATYDLKPEMSAPEVAAECVKRIESGKYDVVILNFANCDMVGHTGVFDAAVKAVEAVDTAVDQVVTAVLNAGGCAFITADHGNAEKMMNPDGTPFTAHTTNVVPFVAVGCGDVKLREGGCLADIAPTMLP